MPKKIPTAIRGVGSEYLKTVTTMLTNAFGLVAALAWNEVIKGAINKYIPTGSGLLSELIYALIVTILLVVITIQLGKMAALIKQREERNESKNNLHGRDQRDRSCDRQ